MKIWFSTVCTSSVISALLESSPFPKGSYLFVLLHCFTEMSCYWQKKKSMETENKSTTNSRKFSLTKTINVIEFVKSDVCQTDPVIKFQRHCSPVGTRRTADACKFSSPPPPPLTFPLKKNIFGSPPFVVQWLVSKWTFGKIKIIVCNEARWIVQ